jgi:DNA polymerase-4
VKSWTAAQLGAEFRNLTELQRVSYVCRSCLSHGELAGTHCSICGSGRVVVHRQLFELSVAHIDCDAFYAAIEKRDNPDLAHRPVIVGGGVRGVVSTCCYLARTFGVRSAMPMFKARRACPDAVIVKPRMDVYVAEGRRIRERMRALTPLVEPVSIDEAYLDLSGTARLHGAPPAMMLARLQKEVEEELGLTVSVGLSGNKFLAKIASEQDKPRGYFVLHPAEAPVFLAPKSVRALPGVGGVTLARLQRLGLGTVADLQRAGEQVLEQRLGEFGRYLWACAHGRHDRPVTDHGERKSVSSEVTLDVDLSRLEDLEDILWRVCQRTSDRAKAAGVEGRVVTLKLKTTDFRLVTRRATLSAGTQLAQVLFRSARTLLLREASGQAYRLVGVGLSDLGAAAPDALDLADPVSLKRAAAERAADAARAKYGSTAVTTGRGARAASRRRAPGD